jgi:predicted dehydrogenase
MNSNTPEACVPGRSLVVGYGSIGKRHEHVLRKMGTETAVVSRHAKEIDCTCFSRLDDAMREFCPDYVVVANRTCEHEETLHQLELLGFSGTCLVEKPLADKHISQAWNPGFTVWVGYVLRFHPLILQAAEVLRDKRLISIQAYVGQYLPDWRPGTDYRECYSASKAQGGGVLRDLSHELDYLGLLAGAWDRVSAIGGHLSSLEIESDDVFGLLIETEDCPVVLCQLNYLDRMVRRDCSVQYEGGSLHLDFVENRLVHNGQATPFQLERNEIFESMHRASWATEQKGLCSYPEANRTLELIEAAEKSSRDGIWIKRNTR